MIKVNVTTPENETFEGQVYTEGNRLCLDYDKFTLKGNLRQFEKQG